MKLLPLRILTLLILTIFSSPLAAQEGLADLADAIKPAVVLITTYDDDGGVGTGTGFFVQPGVVVSNWHVVRHARRIKVTTSAGNAYYVKSILARNTQADLALLKITDIGTHHSLVLAQAPPRVGERIVVVGNPRGLGWTVSEGIVSAYRDFPDEGRRIQITAPISPGSSGSPVLNMRGEVIGIIQFLIQESQNLNFAIPMDLISELRNATSGSRDLAQPRSADQPNKRTVTVLADNRSNGWTNTGLFVSRNQQIHVTARGRISLGLGRSSDPNGDSSISDRHKLLLNAPTGALIAVIGNDNDDFFIIGSEREFSSQRAGYLFLGINEGDLQDNSGAFEAFIQTSDKEPPPGDLESSKVEPQSAELSQFFKIGVKVRADNAGNGWTNSGLIVRRGQRLRISATGRITLGGGRFATPEGVPGLPDRDKLMRNQPTGGLIAVIGDDNDDFIFIGANRDFVAQRDGALFLGVNEGNLGDNTGVYDAIIEAEALNGPQP